MYFRHFLLSHLDSFFFFFLIGIVFFRPRLDYSYFFEFLVSKETVVLRRWERSKQKFGFIKRVDKG